MLINRHELISHFYSDVETNEQGKSILEMLKFDSYHDALQWIASEFCRVRLDWHELGAGSPYPKALPNVVRRLEEETHTKLEDIILTNWPNLSNEQRLVISSNYEVTFGHPELVQGKNKLYCHNKYEKWLSLRKDI